MLVLSFAPFGSAQGFYRIASVHGRSSLIASDGSQQLLLAANHIRLVPAGVPDADLTSAYMDQRAADIITGLKENGFNAIGGDADADIWHRGLPYIESLDLSSHLQATAQTPAFDVFAPDFRASLDALVAAACTPRAQDPDLIGYVSDQGLGWDPVLHPGVVLAFYLSLPLQSAGRQHAMDYLRIRYRDNIRGLEAAWGIRAKDFTSIVPPAASSQSAGFLQDAFPFAEQVLVRYLQTAADAIHAADPNHLFLGANLAFDAESSPTPGSDAALAWGIPDVLSVSLGLRQNPTKILASLQRLSAKPVLLRFNGCGRGPLPAVIWANDRFIGYVWTPDGDWQSGPCAQQLARVWRAFNRVTAGRR